MIEREVFMTILPFQLDFVFRTRGQPERCAGAPSDAASLKPL
jgi:hypothetical protein